MKLKITFLAILMVLVGCSQKAPTPEEKPPVETPPAENNPVSDDLPIVTLTMENGDVMTIELYPSIAPNTVNSFIDLVQSGYYDGLTFHRVIPTFMIQGGDPDGNGGGGPGYSIDGEFTSNGFENNLDHERGVLSMARTAQPNSAGSQFFIIHEHSPHLNGDYAAFGKVITNLEAIDTIVGVETGKANAPLVPQRIQSMSVDTKGVNYPKPEVNK